MEYWNDGKLGETKTQKGLTQHSLNPVVFGITQH